MFISVVATHNVLCALPYWCAPVIKLQLLRSQTPHTLPYSLPYCASLQVPEMTQAVKYNNMRVSISGFDIGAVVVDP